MKVNKSNRNKGFRLFKLSERTRKAFVEQKKFRSVLCVTNGNSPLHPWMADLTSAWFVQVNLCQKLLFLHQLTHNMMTDCSFNYVQVQYMKIPGSKLGRKCCVQKLFLAFRTIFVHNMFSQCSAKRSASDKDLPVLSFICV